MTSADKTVRPTVLHIITGLGDGGAQAVLYALCKNDSGTLHHVVSLSDAGKYGSLLMANGISVTCLNMPRGRVTLSGLRQLWKAVHKQYFDAVQTWMYHADLMGGFVARLAGQRNVVWGIHHTTLVPGQSRGSTILVAKLCAYLSRIVPRRIICCAQESRSVHASLGYDDARMRVVPNGYDLSVFRPDPEAGRRVRSALSIDPSEPLIGFVARYDPQKDHDTLLLALARLHSQGICPRCLLVGTGLDAGNHVLMDRISSLGLQDKILLLGKRSDVPSVMNALDLHVMSSSFGEAFPNVLSEAMACGTPCVSTNIGDAAVILGDTGTIVPPKQPDRLADSIAGMLAERTAPEWASRKYAARQRVIDLFSIERMVERYHEVWFPNACSDQLESID